MTICRGELEEADLYPLLLILFQTASKLEVADYSQGWSWGPFGSSPLFPQPPSYTTRQPCKYIRCEKLIPTRPLPQVSSLGVGSS